MCVAACTKKIATDLGRRRFLTGAGLVAAGLVAGGCVAPIQPLAPAAVSSGSSAMSIADLSSVSRIVDLTHTLVPEFPTYFGNPQLELETLVTLEEDGYNGLLWRLVEHTGTHLDAPFHFSDRDSADLIPVSDLIGPLAVVDIRTKAEEDPDAQLTPNDIAAWESEHGPLPAGAIVAMNSGWDQFVNDGMFRNADADGVMHFPGFHVEAVEFLLEERDVKGIFVDTLSLDHGPSADFAVHYRWLPANRWGMECVANLGDLPALGATVIVGGPKIAGATGGPARVIALV